MSIWRAIVVILSFSTILILIQFYLEKYCLNLMQRVKVRRFTTYMTRILLLSIVWVFFSRILQRSEVLPHFSFWLAFSYLGFIALLFLSTLGLRLLAWGLQGFSHWIHNSLYDRSIYHIDHKSNQKEIVDTDRRTFLYKSTALPALTFSTGGMGYGIQNTRDPDLIEMELSFDNLPPSFDGYRMVQISDLHVGLTIRKEFVQKVVNLAMKQSADAIMLTGDLMDGSVEELANDMESLTHLQARDGVFYCTGNHEYYSGADRWVDYFQEKGFTCLLNQHHVLKRGVDQMAICGINDLSAHKIIPSHKSDARKALKGLTSDVFKVMLAHQPKSIQQVPSNQIDLMLSGHTHAGQFFPWSLFVRLVQPYFKGLYQYDQRTQLYVNQGTGYWGPPIRINTTCEVTLITLKRSSNTHT